MTDKEEKDLSRETEEEKNDTQEVPEEKASKEDPVEELKKSLKEANDKYIRLYADFENYKKIAAKNKEELLKYANEGLMTEILTVIDNLELALEHSAESTAQESLAEGVELTLKELKNVLEKNGLTSIEALGKPFDPSLHHAMSQIETDEADENTVIKEFRKGYMLKERIIRAPLVGVAKKQSQEEKQESDSQ